MRRICITFKGSLVKDADDPIYQLYGMLLSITMRVTGKLRF